MSIVLHIGGGLGFQLSDRVVEMEFSLPDQGTLDYHPFTVGLEFQLSEQVVEMESNLLKVGVVRRRN